MRTLVIDIETSPNLAHVWGLWNQNVSLSQLMESGSVICFAAKWVGESGVYFYSDYHDGHEVMIREAYSLIDSADAVVHYNGRTFDIPHLQREFLVAGYAPPAPFDQIDLLRVVKKQFRFTSNKLDYVVRALGLGQKTAHQGHTLWVRCLNGDAKAWDLMRRYNVQDVRITEKLYKRLLPWIDSHPHVALYKGEDGCPNCGSTRLQRRGLRHTRVSAYPRYQCQKCGRWTRGARAEVRVDAR